MSDSGRDLSDEAISLATGSRKFVTRRARINLLLLHCEARHVARRELLIRALSIGGHAAYAAALHQSGNSRPIPERGAHHRYGIRWQARSHE